MAKVTYRDSGVDVDEGDALVDWLQDRDQQEVNPHHQGSVLSGIGGFAAVFRAQFSDYKKPCLVSSTDGIGTKVLLASRFQNFKNVAQDLVAMCVNDLICTGAKPLFFLDYYASGKLDRQAAQEFLKGVRRACSESHCVLIGGETAEMPGVYSGNDFDAAGFSVGVVDEEKMLGANRVRNGDLVIGISSNGFHSNGFSLLRRLYADEIAIASRAIDEKQAIPEKVLPVIEELLKPTALYVELVHQIYPSDGLHAVAHITGGGMENLPRVMPKGSELHLIDWAWPEPFLEVQDRSGMSREEMLKTLNCGIGLCLFVDRSIQSQIETTAQKLGFKTHVLGKVSSASDVSQEARVVY